MIILMGQTHDDVLYFENILRNKRTKPSLFGQFPCITGYIFNQEVTIVYNAITSYVCGLIVQKLIETLNPLCILLLGKCKSVTPGLKEGDIAISRRIAPIDIDQSEYFDVKVGQIPNIKNDFYLDHAFLDLVAKSFEATNTNAKVCTFLSANKIYTSLDELKPFGEGNMFLGIYDEFVLDSDCISPFICAKFYSIPFVSIKVVDSKIGKNTSTDTFVKCLGTYAKVGRSISSFIGEIGRRDLI